MAIETAPQQAPAAGFHWWQRIGPGLIAACVVIGPGSILTSSQTGATHGFAMSWVVAAAVLFMMVYTTLGAKLGAVASGSAGTLVAERAGRWLAVLIGCGVFFISATFQFGNNMGVDSAIRIFAHWDYSIVLFNVLSIAFLLAFQNIYRVLERLMMLFVALMLICFAANLGFAQFLRFRETGATSLGEFAAGLVPGLKAAPDISLLALVGTTFVITAAYYQSYLVRQKGWGKPQLAYGLLDARVGSVIMALITLMIMSTAGTVLRGQHLENVGQVADQLEPLFGRLGLALFGLGLFSAAYSSIIVNSIIGGVILADGLGLGQSPGGRWPRFFTIAVLLVGMCVALLFIKKEISPVAAIVAAQAVTVIAAPLMAGALLWLTNREDIMGDERNGVPMNIAAGLGFLLLLAMAWYTATAKVWPAVSGWLTVAS